MKFILLLKNWQVFILTYGALAGGIFLGSSLSHEDVFVDTSSLQLSVIPFLFFLFLWMYSVGSILNSFTGTSSRLPSVIYKVGLVMTFVLICCGSFITPRHAPVLNYTISGFVLMMFYYFFYYCAKVIRAAELQREAEFSESFYYLILIVLFPVGIWIIQPKLNRLVKSDKNKE